MIFKMLALSFLYIIGLYLKYLKILDECMYSDLALQCLSLRNAYKEILKGDKLMDDLQKQVESSSAKAVKLTKQALQYKSNKKYDPGKAGILDREAQDVSQEMNI